MALAKMVPHLWYAKGAEEAAAFYASIFPNSRVDSVVPLRTESPSGPEGSVKLVRFTLFGQELQAITAGKHHDFNDAVSMLIRCDTQDEIDRYWNALVENGGKAVACGWVEDRWGFRWQITYAKMEEWLEGDPARAKRVTDVFLKMKKVDVAALEAAAAKT